MISQNLMYECLTDRQVSKASTRHTKSLPLQVAVGLTIHSKTRSKFIVDLMHKIGCSIDYSKVLRVETAIANAVLQKMTENDGIYIPPQLMHGKFVFCAADNLDFLEDTPDGKGTLHATVMVCYQQQSNKVEPKTNTLTMSGPAVERSLRTQSVSIEERRLYSGPRSLKPVQPVMTAQIPHVDTNHALAYAQQDLLWLLSKYVQIRSALHEKEHDGADDTSSEIDTSQGS